MRPADQGFLLLTSPLGIQNRHVITPAQMRLLKQRIKDNPPQERNRQMIPQDLTRLGYSTEQAEQILSLLSDTDALERYLQKGAKAGCVPLTWLTPGYPKAVLQALKADSPGSLWAKGELSVLNRPCVSLVGSRDLRENNRFFAQAVGHWAAQRGYVLVSGNARGADRAAQDACLEAGGSVISVVADGLLGKTPAENMLLLSEDGFDLSFTAQRAISRNRVIHAMGKYCFIAQCSLRTGGTWSGAMYNLRRSCSPLYCFDDGSEAAKELIRLGTNPITIAELDKLD